ncbi:MAG: glycoside hydrolase family 3 C-terminal domain-containing protein [Eubacteriales bacterium]|nr:glycoside hydrolase family 3 C-terminal domain-containing protein [Eubacteriales bacterium]
MMRHALGYRGDYELRFGENAGNIIPGSELFGDHVQGVSTDFPAIISMGQSWNKELVEKVGEVIGTENLYTTDFLDTISNFNAVTCTAMQDLRVNPLSGRYDEGFGEDYHLVSEMIDAMATGASGIAEEENEEGFWTKCIVTTKHYTNYAGQQFRRSANVANSRRGVMEQQARNIKKGIEDGSVSGFMTSYGRTAGIPNSLSPLVQWIQSYAPWGKDGGAYVVTDFSSDWQLYSENAMGNGYDNSYVPAYSDALALMLMARTGQGAANDNSSLEEPNTENQDATLAELENGTSGLTLEDIEKTARAQLIPLIRNGVFNERDENGYPVNYPFTSMSMGAGNIAYDYTNEEHQAVALQAAQESIVLLKNDNNVLPLSKDSKVAVSGPLADARFKTTYAVGQTPDLENAGLTISRGMMAVAGEDNITLNTDGNIVVLKSSQNDKYLVAGENVILTASAESAETASKFEAYSWGQADGYSYKCVDEGSNNGLWLKFSEDSDGNIEFGVIGTEALNVADTGLTATSYTSTLPSRISVSKNENGTVNILLNCYSESFFGAEEAYYKNTRLLTTAEDGTVGYTDQIVNAEGEASLRAESGSQFTVETVQETGSLTINEDAEYAVVVIGAPTRHSAGEGSDRSDLYLGSEQYDLVETVAASYPGKTIVVINSVFPVIVEDIQNNENVAAIVYTPYGGQYDGFAAGQVIYGDVIPTGKLTSTWYADMSALPLLDDYSIPEGTNNTINLDGIAPRYTVDITQADAAATGLTYQYTSAPVTYEFGYGLSYTTFEYSDLTINSQDANGNFTATVSVTNTGTRDGAEIVQLYASNPNSTYGLYAPKKRLVAFEKVNLQAGETKEVTLSITAEDMALWNTNADNYEVEAGTYTFEAASSSQNVKDSVQAEIAGTDFDGLDISQPTSVYDKSFAASSEVTYCEYSKAHTAENLKNDVLIGGYSSVMSKSEGAWTALNGVNLDNIQKFTASVAYNKEGDTGIEVHLDAPDGEMIAEFTFGATEETSYTVDAVEDYDVHELTYTDVEVPLSAKVSGIHDLYLVFKNADTRIYSIQGVQ